MLERIRKAGILSELGAIALCLSLGSPLAADDPLPTTEDETPSVTPTRPESEAPKPANPLDQKLKAAIDGGKSEIEQLEQVIEKMRLAGRRIEARDVGAETTKVQKQVVDDLEALLELLKNAQRDKQKQQQKPNSDPNQRPNQNQQSDPKNSSAPDGASSPAGNPQNQRSEAEKSRESEERREAARRGAAEEERRQQMIKDVWGHLPPHLREAMLNSFSEKYLPKYEDLVKRYYEALAEKNRNRSSK